MLAPHPGALCALQVLICGWANAVRGPFFGERGPIWAPCVYSM